MICVCVCAGAPDSVFAKAFKISGKESDSNLFPFLFVFFSKKMMLNLLIIIISSKSLILKVPFTLQQNLLASDFCFSDFLILLLLSKTDCLTPYF